MKVYDKEPLEKLTRALPELKRMAELEGKITAIDRWVEVRWRNLEMLLNESARRWRLLSKEPGKHIHGTHRHSENGIYPNRRRIAGSMRVVK